MQLHAKSFIPARQDPFCNAGLLLFLGEIFPCNRFSPSKWKEIVNQHINLKKSLEVHFNRLKLFPLYFYHAYDVNLWEKYKQLSLQNFMILWTFLKQWEFMDFCKQIPVETCPSLLGWKLISPCNCRVKSVPAGGLRRVIVLILHVNTFSELTGSVFYISITFFFASRERNFQLCCKSFVMVVVGCFMKLGSWYMCKNF